MTVNDRKKVLVMLFLVYLFDLFCLTLVLFNFTWQMMYIMNWLALLGAIIYSTIQFRWIDSK
jgi:hypothetical protein